MPITLVQTNNTWGGSSFGTPSTFTAGNLIVFVGRGGPSATVTGNNSNPWAKAVSISNGGDGLSIWFVANCRGGADNCVATGFSQAVALEYSGLATVNPLGPTNSTTLGNTTVYAAGSIITNSANALLIGGVSNTTLNGLTDTPSGGFTDQVSTSGNVFAAHQIVSSTGTYNYGGTLSGSVNTAAAVAAFYVIGQPPLNISGNCGVAGALISATNEITAQQTFTVSDASGNYTLANLTAGTFRVAPVLIGRSFSAPQAITLVSSNVTGVNFSVTAAVISPAPTVSDPFVGSFIPGWTAAPAGFAMGQITANGVENTALSTTNGQIFTGNGVMADQSSEVTLAPTYVNEASNYVSLFLRWQPDTQSGYQCNIVNSTGVVARYIQGGLQIISAAPTFVTPAFAPGDVIKFQASGGIISLYQNNNRIWFGTDATFTTGYPGFSQYTTTNITHNAVRSFRAYNNVQYDGVWTKYGVAIPGIAQDYGAAVGGQGWLQGGTTDCSQILHEANAQILSGTVYKVWFSTGDVGTTKGNIGYAESVNAINWVRYPSYVLTNFITPAIWKVGGTYYMYVQPMAGAGTAEFQAFTSPDGINWTLAQLHTGIKPTAAQWDSADIWDFQVVDIVTGTWYGLYAGGNDTSSTYHFKVGLATSADGLTWTKYVSNPVLQNGYLGCATKVGSIYYAWLGLTSPGQGGSNSDTDPTMARRWHSSDLINWIFDCNGLNVSQLYQGVNAKTGQAYPTAIFNGPNGNAWIIDNSGAADAPPPLAYNLGLVVGPAPISQIVSLNEDGVQQILTDNFPGGGLDVTKWTNPVSLASAPHAINVVGGNTQVSLIAANCIAGSKGAFSNDQYAEVTVSAMVDTLSYVIPVVRQSASGFYDALCGGTAAGVLGTVRLESRDANNVETFLGPTVAITYQLGDVLRLIAQGSSPVTLSLYQNGFLILQVQDWNNFHLAGQPAMFLYSQNNVVNAEASKFSAGNAPLPNPMNAGSGDLGPGFDLKFRL